MGRIFGYKNSDGTFTPTVKFLKEKATYQKSLEEMNFDEIVDWATGKIFFGIAHGESLRSIVFGVLQALIEVWKKN
jgi:hypothetical protein